MQHSTVEWARERSARMMADIHIALTPEERERMDISDFGLNELEVQGLELVEYINTDRYCAKELVLLPRQTCPEHRHPPIVLDDGSAASGKKETFRCRWGRVWLYVAGEPSEPIHARIPPGSEPYYTMRHEIELNPGDQYTIPPDALHWFQADEEGAVFSEFSTTNRAEYDVFTDPRIDRDLP